MFLQTNFALGERPYGLCTFNNKKKFNPVSRITTGSWLEQNSNTKGYLEDFSRIYMGSLKNQIRIIIEPRCNHISIPVKVILSRYVCSLRKTVGKVSPILVTLTSCSDSDFESSIVSFKENKPDGVNPSSNDIDYCVRKNEGKTIWFSADCMDTVLPLLDTAFLLF